MKISDFCKLINILNKSLMKIILIHFIIFLAILYITSYIFNHINPWIAMIIPTTYIYIFNNLNNKINEKFS